MMYSHRFRKVLSFGSLLFVLLQSYDATTATCQSLFDGAAAFKNLDAAVVAGRVPRFYLKGLSGPFDMSEAIRLRGNEFVGISPFSVVTNAAIFELATELPISGDFQSPMHFSNRMNTSIHGLAQHSARRGPISKRLGQILSLQFIDERKNIFVAGIPGGGKTYMFNQVVPYALSQGMQVGWLDMARVDEEQMELFFASETQLMPRLVVIENFGLRRKPTWGELNFEAVLSRMMARRSKHGLSTVILAKAFKEESHDISAVLDRYDVAPDLRTTIVRNFELLDLATDN